MNYSATFIPVNLTKEHQLLNTVFDNYRAKLDAIPDDEFDVTSPSGGWSYAEVYSHIMQATFGASIALERCTQGTNKPVKGGINLLGRYVMFTNRFPPIKTKVPAKVAEKMPALKISKEEAKNLIIKCRKRMDDMAALIESTPSDRRSKHPRLGTLNSVQWFRFIRIHLQHHYRQLGRIAKELK